MPTPNEIEVQIEDAQNDVAKQLDQIKNFVASGVDAIIVNPVDTSATQAMTDAAAAGNIPLVYVNRQPVNLDTLPDNQAFVASERARVRHARNQGNLPPAQGGGQGGERLHHHGRALEPGRRAAHAGHQGRDRRPDCGVKIKIIDEQTSNWTRDEAQNLMTNWLSTSKPFDAVIANNDEMAIGAIQAMKAAGMT